MPRRQRREPSGLTIRLGGGRNRLQSILGFLRARIGQITERQDADQSPGTVHHCDTAKLLIFIMRTASVSDASLGSVRGLAVIAFDTVALRGSCPTDVDRTTYPGPSASRPDDPLE